MNRLYLYGSFVIAFIVVTIFLVRYLLLKVIFDPTPLSEEELISELLSSPSVCSSSSHEILGSMTASVTSSTSSVNAHGPEVSSDRGDIRILDKIFVGSVPVYYYLEIFSKSSKTIVLICHGNSGNILTRKYLIDTVRKYCISFCIFDYRGYGVSYGKHMPSISSMSTDTKELFEYIRNKYPDYNIVLWGESLGALVICNLFSRYPCFLDVKTVLFAPFLGVRDLLMRYSLSIMNVIIFPWSYLSPFSIAECIRMKKLLIIVSSEDGVSDSEMVKRLFPESEIIIISGSHLRPVLDKSVINRIEEFILS